MDPVDGVAPEYAAMCRRTMGEEQGNARVAQAGALVPQMTYIFV